MHHPQLGMIELEFSTFTVDGRPDLNMMVFNPASEASRVKIDAWVKQGKPSSDGGEVSHLSG
ncbi:Uncharacterised protein [Raoultella planticola]|nr:Uncharacterised protein [Raoultella planticola]